MITAADSKADLKKILCWLIINKAQPNFYSMDNSIQVAGYLKPLTYLVR